MPRLPISPAIAAALLGCVYMTDCSQSPKPPIAKVVPHRMEKHGHVRTDNYFWLRDRDNPEVISYLEAENRYADAVMAPFKGIEDKLVSEFKARIKQSDESVPYRDNGYFYYSRTIEGKNYPVYCRRKGSLEAPEEVLIDVNKDSEGHGYYSVAGLEVSPDNKLLAWGADSVGRRFYTIRFRNLETGAMLPDEIKDVTPRLVWAADNKTLFYAKQDPQTLRAYRIYRHVLGTDAASDALVYEEKDDTFSVSVYKTKSQKFLIIHSGQTMSDEARYLDASTPAGEFRVLEPRKRGLEYTVDHAAGSFFIRTNDNARNFRLMKAPEAKPGKAGWTEVLGHRDDTYLDGFELFKDFLVATERKNGLIQLRVRPWSGEEHMVDFGEPAYVASPRNNAEFDTTTLRYSYSSLATPPSVFDYDMVKRERKLLKQDEVGGGFSKDNYQVERVYAPGAGGAQVPVSLVYRKPFQKDGARPLFVYAYGSYGLSRDPSFDPYVVSLLDRGFVYAIAHIRGGQELGRQWYEDGKLLNKKNTFTDFIDVTEHLLKEKYGDPKRVFARGGSAGGLLMGAVMTMRPELYTGIIADVPFVDVITTMLDDSIPLTTSEYDEWGNPNDKTYYDYMLSYSPYDQTTAAEYPHLLVTTGLHDSQVQYWEPAKWVAKIRAIGKGDHKLLLKTQMQAGHGGASARDARYRETAMRYSFLLDLAGVK